MIGLSPEAELQLDRLRRHYEALGRLEAAENLFRSLDRASHRILQSPGSGVASPRPYPSARRLGFLWIKEGRYWIAYTTERVPMIVGVFYDTANIPGRL